MNDYKRIENTMIVNANKISRADHSSWDWFVNNLVLTFETFAIFHRARSSVQGQRLGFLGAILLHSTTPIER